VTTPGKLPPPNWPVVIGVLGFVALLFVCLILTVLSDAPDARIQPARSTATPTATSTTARPSVTASPASPSATPSRSLPAPLPLPSTSAVLPHPDQDPRFDTCAEAKAHGYGPYYRGQDVEYTWYRDGDSDGIACE
jgi:hypothetical protein